MGEAARKRAFRHIETVRARGGATSQVFSRNRRGAPWGLHQASWGPHKASRGLHKSSRGLQKSPWGLHKSSWALLWPPHGHRTAPGGPRGAQMLKFSISICTPPNFTVVKLGRFRGPGPIFRFPWGPALRTLALPPGARAPVYILRDAPRGGSFGGSRPKASFSAHRASPRPRWRYLPGFLQESAGSSMGAPQSIMGAR